MARAQAARAGTARAVRSLPRPADVETEIVEITPDVAADWLNKNTHNRDVKWGRVEEFARDMKAGRWTLTGEAVKFAWDDKLQEWVLMDGQNRLWAVVESGATIFCLVVWGVDRNTQPDMDQGTKRTLADNLKLAGENNVAALQAIINLKWREDQGVIRSSRKPTIREALDILKKHAGLREAATVAQRLRRHLRVPVSVAGVCWYDFASIDRDATVAFFEKLETGISLEAGSPILALRDLLNNKTRSHNVVMAHALFIKAWNAYRDGREVVHLQWRASGTAAESFPVPR